ncbi:hypothetical protein [Mesorhizobium sp. M0771]|uniref:hypothetical protein n=1 Tax=Mesorhizobium sp. M0771 TaxID=2956997 RepID=UPI00333B96CE
MMKRATPVSLREKERLTPAEYLRLRAAEPGFSRLMVIRDRMSTIRQHATDLQGHGISVDRLFEVLMSTPIDVDTLEVGRRSVEEIIDEISLQLIAAVSADVALSRRLPEASVRSGQLLADSVINDIVLELVEQARRLSLDIPDGLLSLLQMRIDPKIANPVAGVDMETQKALAIVAIARNPSISTRKLASVAGVNQSTALRWKADSEVQALAKSLNKTAGPRSR